jgi:hypothetical protein
MARDVTYNLEFVQVFFGKYYQGYEIKRIRQWLCSMHDIDKKLTDNFVRKLEGKKPLGRHGRRWEDNIKNDLKNLAQDRVQLQALVDTVINTWAP